jgi:hypothetical protein
MTCVELDIADVEARVVGLHAVAPPGGEAGGADDRPAAARVEALEEEQPVGVAEDRRHVLDHVGRPEDRRRAGLAADAGAGDGLQRVAVDHPSGDGEAAVGHRRRQHEALADRHGNPFADHGRRAGQAYREGVASGSQPGRARDALIGVPPAVAGAGLTTFVGVGLPTHLDLCGVEAARRQHLLLDGRPARDDDGHLAPVGRELALPHAEALAEDRDRDDCPGGQPLDLQPSPFVGPVEPVEEVDRRPGGGLVDLVLHHHHQVSAGRELEGDRRRSVRRRDLDRGLGARPSVGAGPDPDRAFPQTAHGKRACVIGGGELVVAEVVELGDLAHSLDPRSGQRLAVGVPYRPGDLAAFVQRDRVAERQALEGADHGRPARGDDQTDVERLAIEVADLG